MLALDHREWIPRLGVHQLLALYVVCLYPAEHALMFLSGAVDPQPLSILPGCNLVDGADIIFISYASFLLMEICECATHVTRFVEYLSDLCSHSSCHTDFDQGSAAQ